MRKTLPFRLVALALSMVLILLLMPVPTSAEVYGEIKLTKCYNENGKFVMQVETADLDFGTLEVFLTDEGGDVVDRWDNISHSSYSMPATYSFPRDYSTTPTGSYSLNIVYTGNGTFGEESKSWSWAINHTKKVSISLAKNFKVKNTDGTYSHKFAFSQSGGQGMQLHCEIYTKTGKLIRSFETYSEYDKSTWTVKWNYFPDSGVKMKSGNYIIKYWMGDGNPKQTTVNLSI